ncbi:hypothetical protein HDU97_005715 [Phlyctochytrium planicorne]|nr:hypothetical protein HDU97_005715 [Phlyctochytrium planicorne]
MMTEFADVAGDDAASNDSDSALRPVAVFISDANDIDPSAVTPKELKAWYYFAFAAEGFSTLGVSVLIPIMIESMASSSGYKSVPVLTRNHPEIVSIRASIFTSHETVSRNFLDENPDQEERPSVASKAGKKSYLTRTMKILNLPR